MGVVSREYDLEERLLDYAAEIVQLTDRLRETHSQKHIAGQLLRSGTSPLANHGEANAAESDADFVHKLHSSLKELRESKRWPKLIQRVPLVDDPNQLTKLIDETDQLERIFHSSIRTVKERSSSR